MLAVIGLSEMINLYTAILECYEVVQCEQLPLRTMKVWVSTQDRSQCVHAHNED